MGHAEDCDCGEFESSGSGISEGRIRWLDKRNEIRAAWLVHSIQGSLRGQRGVAESSHELRESSRVGSESPIRAIRTKDDLWKFAANKEQMEKHPLGRLSAQAVEKFISGVQFVDYVRGGHRYQHVGVFYYGDLLTEHGFSYGELFEVFALFGMGAELAVRSADRFGWDVENAKCQPRIYYSCPWAYDC